MLHLLFAVNCLHIWKTLVKNSSSFSILSPNWKVPGICICLVFQSSFSVSFLAILPAIQTPEPHWVGKMCVHQSFAQWKKIMLSGLFTRQHWDRPDIILNKYAWHHLQEIYVMGLSKLSSSSVFNLFFTLLLHAHIPPSQVHTALPFFCYTSTFQACLSNLDRHPAWTDLLCTKHCWTHYEKDMGDMGNVHHCLIPELVPAFALLLGAAVTMCIM